ncbi:hypothetical protein [Polaromonas sp.]|uniref:hypothetical protein n=1 Tax=Polaromonas sp. TaxID=1869339 RepID=UPI003BB77415
MKKARWMGGLENGSGLRLMAMRLPWCGLLAPLLNYALLTHTRARAENDYVPRFALMNQSAQAASAQAHTAQRVLWFCPPPLHSWQ